MMNILKTVTEKIFKMLFYVRAGKYPAAPFTAQSEGRGERREAQLSSPASKAAPKTLSVDWQLASRQHGRVGGGQVFIASLCPNVITTDTKGWIESCP